MTKTAADLVAAARAQVRELAPAEAQSQLGRCVLIDVREPAEYAGGHAPGALSLPLGQLQSGIARIAPGLDTPMILYCASGMRSASGVRMLAALGYTGVHNAGGLAQAVAWVRQRHSGT